VPVLEQIAVVIPAHDEATNLPECLRARSVSRRKTGEPV
jgi:hypothetical protein